MNTLPFLYGIKHSGFLDNYKFMLDYPAICAKKLIDNEVDIALIPVASIPKVNSPKIISDYCIGSFKEVKSVLLLSDVPLEKIKTILLDYQSQTSIHLVQLLALKYWHINPKWTPAEKDFENTISGETAGVVIGDRTFALHNKHPYVYDLSLEWYKFTGFPFVFAAWVANKNIPSAFIEKLNKALEYGVKHLDEVVVEFKLLKPDTDVDLYDYLKNNLDYRFDEDKRKSLDLFYKYLAEMKLINKEDTERIRF